MWQELKDWENRNNAQVFMCVTTEDIRHDLCEYNAFDKDNEDYICEIDDVSESLIFEALKDAHDYINFHYGYDYEVINDHCYDYIVEKLSSKTRGHDSYGLERGQIWNAETKTFESVKDFLAKYKENNNAS